MKKRSGKWVKSGVKSGLKAVDEVSPTRLLPFSSHFCRMLSFIIIGCWWSLGSDGFPAACLDLRSCTNVKLLMRTAWGFSLAFLLFSVRSRIHFLQRSNEIPQFGAGVPLFQASRDSTARRQIQMLESRTCIQSFPKETESTKSEEKGHLPIEMSWNQSFFSFSSYPAPLFHNKPGLVLNLSYWENEFAMHKTEYVGRTHSFRWMV